MIDVKATSNIVEAVARIVGKQKVTTEKTVAELMEKAGQVILKKAIYYCPVDTGKLRASGKVVVSGKGLAAKVSVSFNEAYAIFVHENLEARHDAPTQAKYLERAIRETRGTTKSIVKRELEVGIK